MPYGNGTDFCIIIDLNSDVSPLPGRLGCQFPEKLINYNYDT